MGVLHEEDSHNQSSAHFKDKLWSWSGVGAAKHCRAACRERAVLFAPMRPPVPSLEDFPRGVAFALAPGLQAVNEGGAGGKGDLQQTQQLAPGCCADHQHLRTWLVQHRAAYDIHASRAG